MRRWVRDRLFPVSVVAGLVSIAVVFAATLRVVPPGAIPAPWPGLFDLVPHVNAVLAVVALAAMGRGYLAIRAGRVRRHRRSMLLALGAFGAFLALYLYNVAVNGPTAFGGPDEIYRFVYLPTLIVHISLAVVVLPFLYYVALIGLTYPVAEIPSTRHPRVARPTLAAWAATFLLGIAVYAQLHLVY